MFSFLSAFFTTIFVGFEALTVLRSVADTESILEVMEWLARYTSVAFRFRSQTVLRSVRQTFGSLREVTRLTT